jgi:hypothetical protein
MKRLFVLALAASFFAAACGSDSPTSPSNNQPTFTATLSPATEASGTGNATITFNVTRDAAGNISTASVTFVVNAQGFPANTPINAAHIHTGTTGVNGGVLVSTSLTAGEVVLANGSGSFTKTVNNVDPATAQNIINNPSGFYFNIHTAANPGGVARGQLVKVQ